MRNTKIALILLSSVVSFAAFASRCEQRILDLKLDPRSEALRFFRASLDRQVQARLDDSSLRSQAIQLDTAGMRALGELAYWADSQDRATLELLLSGNKKGEATYADKVVKAAKHALVLLDERERLVKSQGFEVASVRWAQMSRTQGYLVQDEMPERWVERRRLLDLAVTLHPMARLRLLESDAREAPGGQLRVEKERPLLDEQLNGAMARLWELLDQKLPYTRDEQLLTDVANDAYALMRLNQISRQDLDKSFARDYDSTFRRLPTGLREQIVRAGAELMVQSLKSQLLQTRVVSDSTKVNIILPRHYYEYVEGNGMRYSAEGTSEDYFFTESGERQVRASAGIGVELISDPGSYRIRGEFSILGSLFSIEQKIQIEDEK